MSVVDGRVVARGVRLDASSQEVAVCRVRSCVFAFRVCCDVVHEFLLRVLFGCELWSLVLPIALCRFAVSAVVLLDMSAFFSLGALTTSCVSFGLHIGLSRLV